MKSVKEILSTSYKKHEKSYEDIANFSKVLKTNKQFFPQPLQAFIDQISVHTYKEKVLTLAVPYEFYSAEARFHLAALLEFFRNKTTYKIRLIKIIPSASKAPS